MSHIFEVFLIFYLISFAKSEEKTKLLLVSALFRHGARTAHKFYPTDPNRNETFYPIGFAGLTNEGKMGAYKLGLYLRDIYGDFLGEYYTEKEVHVQSTDTARTKMTAQLVLAGLFPPTEKQIWNKDLPWQPIPVSYKSETTENVLQPLKPCPYKRSVIAHLHDVPEIQERYINPYRKIYQYVGKNSGKVVSNPLDMKKIYSILTTEREMNLTLPEWTKEIFPEPAHSIAATVFPYFNHDPKLKQINVGFFLKKIFDDSKAKINGKLTKKIFLYAAHEWNLGFMLDALRVFGKPYIPPYASAILFELHRGTDGQHYMKLRYKKDATADDLKIPGCDVLCPLDKFKNLQKHLIPTVRMKDACRIKNSTNSTETRSEATKRDLLPSFNLFLNLFLYFTRLIPS